MTDEQILSILKTDLLISGTDLDPYLSEIISASKDFIAREGIVLDASSQSDGMLVEMYAAFLYRGRKENNVAMPRYLRYALNNRLFGQEQ